MVSKPAGLLADVTKTILLTFDAFPSLAFLLMSFYTHNLKPTLVKPLQTCSVTINFARRLLDNDG
jgi:hypothetical protein